MSVLALDFPGYRDSLADWVKKKPKVLLVYGFGFQYDYYFLSSKRTEEIIYEAGFMEIRVRGMIIFMHLYMFNLPSLSLIEA